MTFKEKLVILRKSKGLTQDDFASAVGVSRQAVYKWESGQSYPEVPKLLEMKLLFTISIDELLDDNYDLPVPEKKKRKRAPKAEPAVQAVPAPKAAPAPQPAPAVHKAAPAPQPAPVAPKVAPAPQPATVAPKAEPVAQTTPAPKAEPVAQAAPAPKAEPAVAPKAEPTVAPKIDTIPVAPKIDTVPTPKVDTVPTPKEEEPAPITLEDLETEEPVKKGNFFERLFGRR